MCWSMLVTLIIAAVRLFGPYASAASDAAVGTILIGLGILIAITG